MGMRGTRSHNGLCCMQQLNAQQWAVDRFALGLRAPTQTRQKKMVEDPHHLSTTPDVIMKSMHGISGSGSTNCGGQVAA